MEFSQVRWLDDAVGSYLFLNHVTNVALFQCEIVVFLILKPLSIKNLFFWVTWLRGSAKLCLKYSMQKWYRPRELPRRTRELYFINYFFCFQERDYGSKNKIPFSPSRFRTFWVASPIFGTHVNNRRTSLDGFHPVKTKLKYVFSLFLL